MKNKHSITNAILWAAAVIAAAILHAPLLLTGFLLPALAACSIIVFEPGSMATKCPKRNPAFR